MDMPSFAHGRTEYQNIIALRFLTGIAEYNIHRGPRFSLCFEDGSGDL